MITKEEQVEELDALILAHMTIQSGFHAGNNTIGDVDNAGKRIKEYVERALTLAEERGAERTRLRAVEEIEKDMAMIDDHITMLQERNEKGDNYRRYSMAGDYAMLKHTLDVFTPPHNDTTV